MTIRTICGNSGAIVFVPTASEIKVKQNQQKIQDLTSELEQELALIRQLRQNLQSQSEVTESNIEGLDTV